MSLEIYIVAGIVLGLLFTELTGLSPGGIIVPSYLALFLHSPLDIAFTLAAAVGVVFVVKLISSFFFLFGRRRYALFLLLGILFKLGIEFFLGSIIPDNILDNRIDIRLIGWLIPGIIANDIYKQGVPRTLLATGTVTAMVFLLAQGWMAFEFNQ